MTSTVCFSEKNYPDIAGKPLRGAYLREFVRYVRMSLTGKELALAETKMAKSSPMVQHLNALCEKVAGELTDKLDTDAASQYGLDMNDLKGIIKNKAGVHSDFVDVDAAYRMTTHGSEAVTEQEFDKAAVELLTQQMLSYFSICLAVQEHKEKELLGLYAESTREKRELIADMYVSPDRLEAKHMAGSLVSSLAISQQTLNKMREQKAPTADIFQKIISGEDGKGGPSSLLDHALARVLDVELVTESGRLLVRGAREKLIAAANKEFGFSTAGSPPPFP